MVVICWIHVSEETNETPPNSLQRLLLYLWWGGQVYVKNIVDKSRFEVFVYSIFMSIFIDVKINI